MLSFSHVVVAGLQGSETTPGNLPEGVPLDGMGDAPSGPDPLLSLEGLPEALQLMDSAVMLNLYLPKLLLYR